MTRLKWNSWDYKMRMIVGNEGLDREWSYDLHLHQHFNNLYDHTSFSIFDFIYVRDFYTKFELKFNQNT